MAVLAQRPLLGINTAADSTNRLAVRSAAALLTAIYAGDGGSGDTQLKLNKESTGDTASLLFQTNYSGRAELGLTGDNDLHVKVSPDGSGWYEALRVNKDTGVLTALGLSFGGTALGHYEEGTFTPTLYGSSTAGSPTYTEQSGYYTRIGNRCFFEAACIISAIGGAVGQIRMDGLPFPLPNTVGKRASCAYSGLQGISMAAAPCILPQVISNTNDIYLSVTTTTGTASLLWTNVTATFGIRISGHYVLN